MPDPTTYRPAPGTIPESPGVYRFRDPDGRVIYVGKAKSLRQRLNSYFADVAGLHPRTAQMVTSAGSVEWTVVSTEVEALQLEYNWIKEFDPRFNVRYRDDKSYPELAVTVGEQFPRLQVMRGAHRKGVRYFGPYAHAWAIRETLDLLLRVFPARTCSAGVFRRSAQIGRPCLLGYIGKCSAPCVGRVTEQEHREIVDAFCDFMSGKADPLIRRLEREMAAAAAELDFERAARLRDDLSAVRRAVEKQAVVLGGGTDADVVGISGDDLQASVQVFHVRGGRVRGQRGWIVDIDDTAADSGAAGESGWVGALVENFLLQFYGGRAADDGATAVPREILVPALPAQAGDLSEWLSGLRGSAVSLRVPQRGDKRALAETVTRNAAEALAQHRLKRASDLTARSAALNELAATLGMDSAPLRIECIDISHVQGTDVVASLVVFEDALPKRSDYRRFAIRDRPGDDVASIAEVVRRRFSHGSGGRVPGGDRHPAPAGSGPGQDISPGEADRNGDGGGTVRNGDVSAGPAPSDGDGTIAASPTGGDGTIASSPTGGDGIAAASPIGGDGTSATPLTGGGTTAASPTGGGGTTGASHIGGDAAGRGRPGGDGAAGDADPAAGPRPGIDPLTGRPRRFAYPPQLLVVDGGAPQVNAASAVLSELGIADITVCGLAKRLEEVWLPGQDDPVIFPRTSEALYLLQRLRDEAHRFAITYHRSKRSKSMTVSALDNIPGLGQTRRKALLKHFGSVGKLRAATVEDIVAVPGIGSGTAAAIVSALAAEGDRPATGRATSSS